MLILLLKPPHAINPKEIYKLNMSNHQTDKIQMNISRL